MADELISCIMATKDRPRFFRQALRCFLRQTYTSSELVVVDDGEQSVAADCAGVDRVRYVRLDQPASTGAKLNIGVEHARGDILQKLDDDDYYHPDFLNIAAAHAPRENRDSCVVSWDCFLILIVGDGQLRYSGHGWTLGNSLGFTRKFWARAPFRDLARGSDSSFLRDQPGALVRVCAPEHCIVIRHGANTWTDMRSGESVEDYFRRFPVYGKKLAALLPEEDRNFYESLALRPVKTTSPGISA
jgi:glycosyltransferase involved in cell wall biosynthesis